MKNNFNFFIRQTVKLSPRARPSGDPNKIRIKFLEGIYRRYKKLSYTQKNYIIGLFLAFAIPTVLYSCILAILRFDERSKLQAEMTDNFYQIKEILDKSSNK